MWGCWWGWSSEDRVRFQTLDIGRRFLQGRRSDVFSLPLNPFFDLRILISKTVNVIGKICPPGLISSLRLHFKHTIPSHLECPQSLQEHTHHRTAYHRRGYHHKGPYSNRTHLDSYFSALTVLFPCSFAESPWISHFGLIFSKKDSCDCTTSLSLSQCGPILLNVSITTHLPELKLSQCQCNSAIGW